MSHHSDVDPVSGVETTGHEWDGIQELNNPLPRWWLNSFLACVVFAIGYWMLMPSWPLVTGYTKGLLGYSQRAAVLAERQSDLAARAARGKALENASLQDIVRTPALLEYAMANGRAAFANNCAPCHGAGGAGAKGFPNLQADRWLFGGSLDQIAHTITVGVRSTSPDTLGTQMPAFGHDGILTAAQIVNVGGYVRSLSGQTIRDGIDLKAGAQIFAENCGACHGDKGQGNQEIGAPRLASSIWLYGGDEKTVIETITNARAGVMPTWGGKLDPVTIKSLAVYVHSFGGGQ
jgi:cytochrome c oxidase cbb3-type subunit 3